MSYQEQHELGFLERLLLGKVHGAVKAVLLFSTIIAIALAIFHLYVAAFGTPEGRSFRSVHLTVMLTLAIFMFPLFRKSIRDPLVVAGDPRNGLRIAGFGIDLAAGRAGPLCRGLYDLGYRGVPVAPGRQVSAGPDRRRHIDRARA